MMEHLVMLHEVYNCNSYLRSLLHDSDLYCAISA